MSLSTMNGIAFAQPLGSTANLRGHAPKPSESHIGQISAPQAIADGTSWGVGCGVKLVGAAGVMAAARRSCLMSKNKATVLQAVMEDPSSTVEINYYEFDKVDAPAILKAARVAVEDASTILAGPDMPKAKLEALLSNKNVQSMLIMVSRLPVFSHEMGVAFKHDLDLLAALKKLKYFWNLPQSQLLILMVALARQLEGPSAAAPLEAFQQELAQMPEHLEPVRKLARELPSEIRGDYVDNAALLEVADAHAVYPTSIYRQCDALTLATKDASTIEAVMSTTLTTTIKIARNVLDPSNQLLSSVYTPLGRCVAVVDDKVDKLFGAELDAYFEANGIKFTKLVYSGNEVDKDIRDVERILVDMKELGQGRHEPLLVVGGGVIADIAGFAAALYSRNTPYVMLCTSIVSGIDAGPSPRVCCNGFDYKNLYGAYHPPVLTITDRGFWKTLHPGWLRHGVAEIIKMAVMKDITLFELMEKWGEKCLRTNFGTLGDSVDDPEFQDVCDLIVGKAMEGYVRSEYGNLWETHQCRPHAYGHTWSPGYELPAGMLHGQAVGTCMGFGAYLSYKVGFINETEMTRILKVISDCELSLYHPIMDNSAAVWKSQVAMIEKRGGNLCAPIPRPLGESGYLNEISEEDLDLRMKEYKAICQSYPRNGRGVEEHCVDVGLEDPQAKKMAKAALQQDRVVVTPTDLVVDKLAKAAASTEDRGTNGQGAQALNEGLRPMTVSAR